MAFSSKLCLVAAIVVLLAVMSPDQAEAGLFDCYETWSRCSGWSNWGNGRFWMPCDAKCKFVGRKGGNCHLTPSKCPTSDRAYQCQCY